MTDPAPDRTAGRPTIELTGVSKRYGGRTAVASLDLTITEGVTGLLGPNGAGKSTLLRMAGTAIAPTEGSIRIEGLNPADPDERHRIRTRLGYQPQEPGFYNSFTAFDFVDYVAVLKELGGREARRDEVRRVLDKVGLTDRMHTKLRRLSGGMRQRVALAQALLGQPSVLLLDEPTAGLDPEQRLRFRQLATEVADGGTVLLSTHLTEDVVALCPRVIVLHEGALRFDGSPESLAQQAEGRVWESERADPAADVSWLTGSGRHRNLGDPPPAAELVPPSIDDAYLLLVGAAAAHAPQAA